MERAVREGRGKSPVCYGEKKMLPFLSFRRVRKRNIWITHVKEEREKNQGHRAENSSEIKNKTRNEKGDGTSSLDDKGGRGALETLLFSPINGDGKKHKKRFEVEARFKENFLQGRHPGNPRKNRKDPKKTC